MRIEPTLEDMDSPHRSHLLHPQHHYRPDIDGLRGIAVLAVVLYHAAPALMPGGFIGVDVFFVISGYLITGNIRNALEAGRFSLAGFYARRIRRLFPALALVLAAALGLGWHVLLADEYRQLGWHVAGGAAFVSNFVLWSEADYFDAAAATKPLLHLWSLGIEEQFYLAWPWLALLLMRDRRLALAGISALVVASFLWSVHRTATDPVAAFYSPLSRAWELLAGALLAMAGRGNPGSRPGWVRAWMSDVAWLAGAGMLAAGLAWIRSTSPFPGLLALLPVAGSALLILAGGWGGLGARMLAWRPLVLAGLISYPLYLWHWLLISFLHVQYLRDPPPHLLAAAVAASLLLSALTYLVIERRVRYRRGPVAPALAVLMLAVGTAGYVVHARGGFGERLGANLGMTAEQIAAERADYWSGARSHRFEEGRSRIVVFGDSQGKDMYKALSNIEGIGLHLVETQPECTALDAAKKMYEAAADACAQAFGQLLAAPELAAATHLLYVPTWVRSIEPDDHLARYRANVARIRSLNPGIRIVLAGPKPLVGTQWLTIDQIVRGQTTFAGLQPYLDGIKLLQTDELAHARALARELDAAVLDTIAVFCTPECLFYVDNRFTYFDQNHWTAFGAELFARNLLASPQLDLLLSTPADASARDSVPRGAEQPGRQEERPAEAGLSGVALIPDAISWYPDAPSRGC